MKWCIWGFLFCTISRCSILCACTDQYKSRQILIVQQNTMWLRTFLHLRCWNKHKEGTWHCCSRVSAGRYIWHQDCLQSEILKCSFAGWVSEEFERVLEIGRVYLCQSRERDASSLLMCLCSLWRQHRKGKNLFFFLFFFPSLHQTMVWIVNMWSCCYHVPYCLFCKGELE